MTRASAEEQLAFLVSCVRHSNNGKIDFSGVAVECNIISKGAAAKRYERLMKANGINPNGGPTVLPGPEPSSGSPTTTTGNANGGPRKRKAATVGNGSPKKTKVKGEAKNEVPMDNMTTTTSDRISSVPSDFELLKQDPFLSETTIKTSVTKEAAELFDEFCAMPQVPNTVNSAVQTASAGSSTVQDTLAQTPISEDSVVQDSGAKATMEAEIQID